MFGGYAAALRTVVEKWRQKGPPYPTAKDLVDAFPAARDVFDRADAALGFALSALCFDGPADELTLTHNAQPALLAHGAAAWAATRAAIGSSVVAAAGHSLGEFTAYHAAQSLALEDALRLVR